MFQTFATKFARFLLRHSKLSIENRIILTTALLHTLDALPFRDMIFVDDQKRLIINNRVMPPEVMRKLRESARSLQTNYAHNTIREQVLYVAIAHGVHKLERLEQSYFSRAAIWWGEQEEKLTAILAGIDQSELDGD